MKGTSHLATLAMADLLALGLNKLVDFAKVGVKNAEKAKELVVNNKATIPMLGKVVAAMKRLFASEQALCSSMTFVEFWQLKTGSPKVNNHAESCGKCYAAFVDNTLITEKDYDISPADFLEKAAAIYTAVGGDITRQEIANAATVLKERPKDGAKQLQAILDKIKGPREIDGSKALEYLALIYANGLLNTVLASASAEIRHLTDPAKLEVALSHLQLAVDGCLKQMQATSGKQPEKPAPATPATPAALPPAPVETPAPPSTVPVETAAAPSTSDATPDFTAWVATHLGVTEDEREGAIEDVKYFHENSGRLPENADEFIAWLQAAHASAAA